MKYRLTDRPIFHSYEGYLEQINHMLEILSQNLSVKSIYQLGSVSDPGISDIDILVVFKNDQSILFDPRNNLKRSSRYLYTHQLFGMPESLIDSSKQYSLFHNFKHLYGDIINVLDCDIQPSERIKVQIALEYLIRLYVSFSIQKNAKIIKVRPFLLEAKAVKFDLEILGNINPNFNILVDEVIEQRKCWFNQSMNDNSFIELFLNFYRELEITLLESSMKNMMYAENVNTKRIGRNITLKDGNFSGIKNRFRISVPFIIANIVSESRIKHYFSLINVFNKYSVSYPMMDSIVCEEMSKKLKYEQSIKDFINTHAPNFIGLSSPLSRVL